MCISVIWLRVEVEGFCERSNERFCELGDEHSVCINCGEFFE